MSTNVGIGRIGIGMTIRKLGWELEWISAKEEVGTGIQ